MIMAVVLPPTGSKQCDDGDDPPAQAARDLADATGDRILERGRLLRLDGPSVRSSAARINCNSPAAEYPERVPQSFRNAHPDPGPDP
jgi:hypothetical protein